ncbi:MAG: ATP-binding protein [Candidatus Riflebacteria bacterium]|nr:ATP-binding protein [Candidatus Riflebacteria bacterium]
MPGKEENLTEGLKILILGKNKTNNDGNFVLEAFSSISTSQVGLISHLNFVQNNFFETLRYDNPDLVIIDIEIELSSDLQIIDRIKSLVPQVIIIIAISPGSKKLLLEALKLKVNNFISKPIRNNEVVPLLKKYSATLDAQRNGIEVMEIVSHQQFRIRLENMISIVPQITDFLVRATHEVLRVEERIGIRLGLTELVANAIEHGNLEVSYQEKTAALEDSEERFEKLFLERQKHPVFGKRKVEINFFQTENFCEWLIIDEGRGFDWANLPDPLAPENMLITHGRGIFLARFQFDELDYLGFGNMVRIRKRIGPKRF